MNIGIDIDGVLTNLEEYIETYGSKYAIKNELGFDYNMGQNSVYGFLSKEDSNSFWDKYWFKYAENISIREDAVSVIKKLKKDGNKIIIITARTHDKQITKYGDENQKNMEHAIIKWLKKNDIVYDKLIFSGLNKINSCIENNIDVMIEDSPKNISELKNHMKIILFDAKYNKYYNPNGVTRVNNWHDIYNIIIS